MTNQASSNEASRIQAGTERFHRLIALVQQYNIFLEDTYREGGAEHRTTRDGELMIIFEAERHQGALDVHGHLAVWDEHDCFVNLAWGEQEPIWRVGWEHLPKGTKQPSTWLKELISELELEKSHEYRTLTTQAEAEDVARTIIRAYQDNLNPGKPL